MSENEEKLLDEDQWKNEAQAIINDVKCHVREIAVSTRFGSDNHCIYLNITTLESLRFCVVVSRAGFSVIGDDHDLVVTRGNEIFETPYSLLEALSPQYKNSFGNKLTKKLNELARKNELEQDTSDD